MIRIFFPVVDRVVLTVISLFQDVNGVLIAKMVRDLELTQKGHS
jgi:hypothetical protein